MASDSWKLLLKALAGARGRGADSGRRTARVRLEPLEDRLAPAQLLVTLGGDTPQSGKVTLREAVAQANADANNGASDTITFAPGVTRVVLGGTQLELSGQNGTTPAAITIDGGGKVTVDGNNASRVFLVDQGVTASLEGLTVSHGNAADFGGGIYNLGTLAVSSSTLSGNTAVNFGGGLYNGGTVTVSGSTLSGNSATSFGGGGFANSGVATLSGCTVSANSSKLVGGGIQSNSGTLAVIESTISGNTCSFGAGGLQNLAQAVVTVSESTLSGNSGGGISNSGTLTISGSTLSGNSSSGAVGGLRNDGTATVSESTFSGNSGGGVNNGMTLKLVDSIVAGNINGDANGGYTDLGGNLVGGPAGLAPLGDYGGPTQTMALLPGSRALGVGVAPTTLSADNGSAVAVADASVLGLVPGFSVLLIGSEQMLVTAVDLDTNTLTVARGYGGTAQVTHTPGAGVFPAFDQRGQPRLRSGALDAGAVQSQGFTLAAASFSTGQSAPIHAAFALPLEVTLTEAGTGVRLPGGVINFSAPNSGASAALSTPAVTDADGQTFVTATANGTASAPGSYQVTASVAGGNTVSFSLKNLKGTPTVTVVDASGAYTSDAFTASATVTGVGGDGTLASGTDASLSYTYYKGSGTSGTNLGGTAPVSAGTYTVVAHFAGGPNYSAADSKPLTFTIAKADPVIVLTPYSVTYDGTAHTATGTATGVKGESLSGLDLTHTTHTSAGSYSSDSWSFTDTTGNYNSVGATPLTDAIAKANAVLSVTPYSVTYDGTAYTATGSATGVKGEALSGLDLSGTTHTSAGTFSDSWSFTDTTGNYNSVGQTAITDAIAKANAVLSVTPYSVTYDGTAHTASGSALGVDGKALSGLDLSGTTHTSAGTYSDSWSFTDTTGNYNSVGQTAITDVIAKANAVLSVTPYSVTYDGNAHAATGSALGVDGEALSGLDLSGTTHTNAGTFSDPWSFTDTTGNYNGASGAVSDAIARANAVISVTPYAVTYDGGAHAATGSATGVRGEPLAGLDLSGTTHTGAGTYPDSWSFTDPTGNYNGVGLTAITDEIARAPLAVATDPQSKVYGSADPALTFRHGPLAGGDSDSVFSGSLSRSPGENVGLYAIGQGSLNAGPNYALSFLGAALAITPAPLTVTADDLTAVQGGVLPGLTAHFGGFVNGDGPGSLSSPVSLTTEGPGSAPGRYAIVVGGASSPNYSVTFVGGTLTLLPAPPLPNAALSLYYLGLAQQLTAYAFGGSGSPEAVFAAGDSYYALLWAGVAGGNSQARSLALQYAGAALGEAYLDYVSTGDPSAVAEAAASAAVAYARLASGEAGSQAGADWFLASQAGAAAEYYAYLGYLGSGNFYALALATYGYYGQVLALLNATQANSSGA